MAANKFAVAGDQYRTIDERMCELKRQLNLKDGSPLDPKWLADQLQFLVEGKPVQIGSAPQPEVQSTLDPRIAQAHVLWEFGFGRELKFASEAEYLATIPAIPNFPAEYDGYFDLLVLMDARIGLKRQSELLGVNFNWGDDDSFVDFDSSLRPKQPCYWMRCQNGKRNLKRKVRDCRTSFQHFEVGCSAVEGLGIFAQNRDILRSHYMDLPGSVRRDNHDNAAYLNLYESRPKLNTNFDDNANPKYGSASRGTVSTIHSTLFIGSAVAILICAMLQVADQYLRRVVASQSFFVDLADPCPMQDA